MFVVAPLLLRRHVMGALRMSKGRLMVAGEGEMENGIL
jgi:hypothetical protein